MNSKRQTKLFTLLLLIAFAVQAEEAKVKKTTGLVFKNNDDGITATLKGKVATGTSFEDNGYLLNSKAKGARGNKIDRILGNKTKFELKGNVKHDAGIEAQMVLSSKMTWGSSRSISTTTNSVKFGEALMGAHSHQIHPRVIYLGEAWAKFDCAKLFCSALGQHSLTFGMFPFSIGRGISFGSAYAVNPPGLGFFSDYTTNHFAPGVLFEGNLGCSQLTYDLYASVSTSKSTSFKDAAEQIYDNLLVNKTYVSSTEFARGFGYANSSFVARLNWTPVNNKEKNIKINIEPYAVYTHSGAQKLEFTGDAKSKLGTLGLSSEFTFSKGSFGFEGAFNLGHQEVFSWDRNVAKFYYDTTTGTMIKRFSHVYDDAALTTRTIFDSSLADDYRPTGTVDSSLNSAQIGTTGKYNASNRFRDTYKNEYKGWMFVADGSLYIYKRDLMVSAAAGVTKGDIDPATKVGTEREYKGFLSQQELYSGKRVNSLFVMGAYSSLKRPHALTVKKDFVTSNEGFNNLIFAGMGLTFKPENWSRKFSVNPNIIVFWQENSQTKPNSTELISNRLGTEINFFADTKIGKNVKVTAKGAVFLPGKYYTDIKGTVLSNEVATLVKKAQSGITESLPVTGDDTAYTLSLGMEYSF